MQYYLNLFSPETYEAFSMSDRTVSGFRLRQRTAAERVCPGDRLLCYLTKVSRWVGVFVVESAPFVDATPRFHAEDDPYVVRFRVRPLAWLPTERAVPIHEERVWDQLSFTRGQSKLTSTWTGPVRASLTRISQEDGLFLEQLLLAQASNGTTYAVSEADRRRLVTHRVRGTNKDYSVSVPEDEDADGEHRRPTADQRESIRVQAALADIGARMGMRIWIPRSDRHGVLAEWRGDHDEPLGRLPLNYDDTTLKTIEQIDVLWLKGRSIRRAFEVEHTTSIYSGILRMADLLALQPNMDIRLHIVAPSSRRERVLQEIRRPVFSLLDRGPLSETCTYLSYESVTELGQQPHLTHLSDSVLDEYEEVADD